MNEMTPLEAAEKLDKLAISPWSIAWSQKENGICVADLVRVSASYLRKIDAGEYKQVVHGRWIKRETEGGLRATCSVCSYPISWWHKSSHCPSCGALMEEPATGIIQDGKDDSHE